MAVWDSLFPESLLSQADTFPLCPHLNHCYPLSSSWRVLLGCARSRVWKEESGMETSRTSAVRLWERCAAPLRSEVLLQLSGAPPSAALLFDDAWRCPWCWTPSQLQHLRSALSYAPRLDCVFTCVSLTPDCGIWTHPNLCFIFKFYKLKMESLCHQFVLQMSWICLFYYFYGHFRPLF